MSSPVERDRQCLFFGGAGGVMEHASLMALFSLTFSSVLLGMVPVFWAVVGCDLPGCSGVGFS